MSTLENLWNNYWWVLPAALMALCILGSLFSRGRVGGCCCGGRRRIGSATE